jgi:hypothetical protein
MTTPTPVLDRNAVVREIAQLVGLLCHGQPQFVDMIVTKHERVVGDFARKGYSVWPQLPKHPLTRGLAAYRNTLSAGGELSDDSVASLAESALAVNAFERDWTDHRDWMAARLRDPEGCEQALFELRSGLYLRNLGHPVEYVAAKRQGLVGPDLVIHVGGGTDVECYQAFPYKGHRVAAKPAEGFAVQLLQTMERSGLNRVVLVRCRESFRGQDITALLSETRTRLRATEDGAFIALDGRYTVEMVWGGSAESPLNEPQMLAARARLEETSTRWGVVRPASALNQS